MGKGWSWLLRNFSQQAVPLALDEDMPGLETPWIAMEYPNNACKTQPGTQLPHMLPRAVCDESQTRVSRRPPLQLYKAQAKHSDW